MKEKRQGKKTSKVEKKKVKDPSKYGIREKVKQGIWTIQEARDFLAKQEIVNKSILDWLDRRENRKEESNSDALR